MFMAQNQNDEFNDLRDSYSSHLNIALSAISALCSAKPMNASEFVCVIAFIKEWWPSNASTFGMREYCLNYK